MRIGAVASVSLVLMVGSASRLPAQTYVSFEVPLNLTQLSLDIERVRVTCIVAGDGLIGFPSASNFNPTDPNAPLPGPAARQEILVAGGQLVGSIKLIVGIPAELLSNPIGKTAYYGCILHGYSKSLQKWNLFYEAATEAPFKLKVTPDGGVIQGSFVW